MFYKSKIKITSAKAIAIGTSSGVILQLICGGIVAMMVERGSVAENSVYTAALISRMVGMTAALAVTWLLSPEKKFAELMIVCGGLVLLPIVASLLFWDVDTSSLAVSTVLSMLILGAGYWLLNRFGKREHRYFRKKGYR